MAGADHAATSRIARRLDAAQQRLAALYDRLASPARRTAFEHLMVYLAIIGFLLHLLLIFLTKNISALAPLLPLVGANYLAAVYTPFSFILFYEVLLLVFAIPESTTRALGTQFEIISLIFLRNVFKDLALFHSLNEIEQQLDAFFAIVTDMGGGLLLFLMVGLFYHLNSRRSPQEQSLRAPTHQLEDFIARKKIIALVLIMIFFVLTGTSMWRWMLAACQTMLLGTPTGPTVTTLFYTDLFTIIIFTDVLLLLMSLLLSDWYHLVFRNAGFVVATILLRISMTAGRPYNLIAALIGMAFGILVLLIYKYFSRFGIMQELQRSSGDRKED